MNQIVLVRLSYPPLTRVALSPVEQEIAAAVVGGVPNGARLEVESSAAEGFEFCDGLWVKKTPVASSTWEGNSEVDPVEHIRLVDPLLADLLRRTMTDVTVAKDGSYSFEAEVAGPAGFLLRGVMDGTD